MDRRIGYEFRNGVHNILNNFHVNVIVTALMVLVSTYVAFVTILGQSLIHPLTIEIPTTIVSSDLTTTTMSLLILLIISVAVGKFFNMMNIPFIFGAMLVGILIGNFSAFDVFVINDYWEAMARRMALVILIVRWGLSVHLDFFAKNWKTIIPFGFLPGLAELAVMATAAALIFNFSWPIAVILASTMAAASTPVIIPVIIDLQNANLGSEKKVPQVAAASVGIDTLFCLTIFFVTATCVFTTDPLSTTIIMLIGRVFLSGLAAAIVGVILWTFPKSQESHTVFARTFLLLTIALGTINAWFYFNCGYAGIVSIIVMISVATLQWRQDNPTAMFCIEKNFLYLWNMLACPLLFVLVGMKLKFNEMSWPMVGSIFALILIGYVARIIGGMILTSCTGFKAREQLVVLISHIGKATLQGALAPNLLITVQPFPEYYNDVVFIVTACLMTAFVSAPLGRLLLSKTAPALLKKNYIQTVHIAESGDETPTSEKKEDAFESVTFKHFRTLQQTKTANLNGRTASPI